MSSLTRDGSAEPVSRYQILRREQGQGNNMFILPVQLATSRIWQTHYYSYYCIECPVDPSSIILLTSIQ